jgi:sugar lactone lactonase YvrE
MSTRNARVGDKPVGDVERAELVLDCRNHHGEGIFWNGGDGRVWWTDIHGQALWWYDPAAGRSASLSMPDRVCCFAPRERGGFLLALAKSLAFFDSQTGSIDRFAPFEPDNPHSRLNDGRTDRRGRMIVGGMNEVTGAADSTVIRVDLDRSVETIITGVACANSTCFSADGRTMYFADTPLRTISAYDYDPATGRLGARRDHAILKGQPGMPDGSCVDAEGGLWNALWEGSRIIRIAPDGKLDRIIEVPVPKPTCCTFGGSGLETLFITTSRLMSSESELKIAPLSGGLFSYKPGVHGIEDAPFAG